MRIRDLKRPDVPQIARLYYETVRRVNARDYSPGQIQAWAPRIYPHAFWQRGFRNYRDRGRPFNLAVMEKRLPGAERPPAEQ